jgi:rhodanese-related sulfurtransferase
MSLSINIKQRFYLQRSIIIISQNLQKMYKRYFQFTILLSSLILLLSVTNVKAENTYKRFTALQCDSIIKANETNPNFVILDVRTPGEWNAGHINGSINRSTGLIDFTAQLDALPKQKIFLMHCQSGNRSAGAFAKMKELEFAEVYEMIGGLNSWRNNGLPTTTLVEPKLMLVSYDELSGNGSDTLKITITNRANGILNFNAVAFSDEHELADNFNTSHYLEGAEDYTFSIVHSPGYIANDSTDIKIESNGGTLAFNIVFKNGVVQNLNEKLQHELSFYPNPANQNIFFKTDTEIRLEEVAIINIAGQIELKATNFYSSNPLNISNLKNGIYFIRIKTGNQIISKKLIIKH